MKRNLIRVGQRGRIVSRGFGISRGRLSKLMKDWEVRLFISMYQGTSSGKEKDGTIESESGPLNWKDTR